jgi:hypothetical protein
LKKRNTIDIAWILKPGRPKVSSLPDLRIGFSIWERISDKL